MSRIRKSPLYTRTLLAGIALGALAVLTLLTSNWFMQSVGMAWMNGGNPAASFVARLYGFIMAASLPFSAALISAALVMRHVDNRLAELDTPLGRPRQADDAGA